jgi:stearoyl-CoA desaturase (delta-9 desaturase)
MAVAARKWSQEEREPSSPVGNKAGWIIQEPVFGWATEDGRPKQPTPGEALREWWHSVDFLTDLRRLPAALHALFHLVTLGGLVALVGWHLSWTSALYFSASAFFMATVTHTMWLHRYCSHRAFEFRSPWLARVFLWLNGMAIREDTYAIPHRVHHQRSDRVGDPYGPHLGRFGSYLAIESVTKFNTDMTPEQYEHLTKTVSHIGFPVSTYEQFRRTGTVEHAGHLAVRTAVSQVLWSGLAYAVGGVPCVLAWYGAVAFVTFLIRDFNYLGHGGRRPRAKIEGWEFDERTLALNQIFYGVFASEWHNNHHKFPRSANLRLVPAQMDTAFLIIRLLHAVGVVSSYVDAVPRFREQLAAGKAVRPTAGDEAFANATGIADGNDGTPLPDRP